MQNIKIGIYMILGIVIGLLAGKFLLFKSDAVVDHAHTSPMSQETGESQTYICSMHPQIRQEGPGLCPICEMDLIPAGGNESDDPLVLEMTASAVKLANIQTTILGNSQQDTKGKTIRLAGKIQADERQASSQVAHVPGRIEKLYVSFTGEEVSMGQKIADLYSPDLITAQRELLEAVKLQSINPGLLEAARNKLRFWKISDQTITKIESSGRIQEVFPLISTASGIVTKRKVSVGDHLQQGEPLLDLVNLKKVWVLFDAYEEDLINIRVGNQISFTTPAFPEKTFKTNITFIAPLIDAQTRTTAIRAEVNNISGKLKPEMFVTGILESKSSTTNKSNIAVPKTAVMWTGTRSVVYVKVPDTEIPSFRYREIEIGERQGDFYQVIGGLENGEEVVTYGSFTIDAAAQLNNQTSMMNKNVGIKKEKDVGIPNFQSQTPALFKTQLNAVADTYLQLKDALVATDPTTASGAAQQILTTLKEVDMRLLKDEAHNYWMEQLNGLEAHTKNIVELTDVKKQRTQFGFLSEALINAVTAFGTADKLLYVQHCPMAFDNQGADWISTEEQIRNPYFGDKMMKCGLVTKTVGGTQVNDSKTTDEPQGKEYTSPYVCPMHCKGSGSETAGSCPICKMDYVENEK